MSEISMLQEEKEANMFAIALLMPEKHMKRELKKLGIQEDSEIELDSDENIKKLADKFQVSEQLILIRLHQLGFFK